jgi:acyl-coenzyme A synthetase/AMP-(fatty) acid ligase
MTALNQSGGARSVLTDGQHELSYRESERAVQSLTRQMLQRGIDPADYLEFRCEHDLASALLWLALLHGGHSVFVNAVDSRVRPSRAPAFCRLSVSAGWDGGLTLVARDRPDWNGARVTGGQRIVFRTSGTTAAAKLVVHSAEHLLRNAMNCVTRLQLLGTDRLVIPVPVYHMYGLGAAFLPGALAGASMDFQAASNILRYLEREHRFRPNIAFLTPSFMETLVRGRKSPRAYDLTVVAGDVVKSSVFRTYESRFGPVASLYGSTELGAIAAASRLDDPTVRERTVGRAMDGVECRIDGQLWCRHPHGFAGYATEEGDAQPRSADEWFPTSDLARWYEGDYLCILGRIDQSVNRDGVLVALGEVEAAIQEIPGVASVTAVAAGPSPRGKGVVAFCTLADGASLNAESVRRACLERMPRSHVPDRVAVVDAIPILASGKPDRLALARRAEEGSA